VNCRICGREFDERGYQLLVPGRAESFDTFECAARAQGLPWLGPSPRPDADDARPFERRSRSRVGLSSLSVIVAALAGVRLRAALVGATALLVAVTTASAYVWLRDGGGTSADPGAPPGAASVTATEAQPSEGRAEASGASAEPRPASAAPSRSERRGRGSAGIDTRLDAVAGEPATSIREDGEDAGSVGDSAAPAPPASRNGSPPPSPPVLPPRPPSPADPPRPTAPPAPPPAPPVTDAVTAPETRPGWGHGDKNHLHEGPPGRHS
jgi:hypothetical protein